MPKKKKKAVRSNPFFYFWIGFLGFVALCVIFYLSTLYGNKHAIDIGLVSGDTASVQAAQLAVDQVNAMGGLQINGSEFPVKLTVRMAQNAAETKSAVQSLIDEGVLVIIGPQASGPAMIAREVAKSQEVLLVAPVASSPASTYNAFQTVFSAIIQNGGFDRAGLLQ